MWRSKEKRYTQALHEPLLIQEHKDFFNTCAWRRRSDFFRNNNPLILELACGRWEYTTGLAKIFLEKNFLGVDIKAERMIVGINRWRRETWLPDAQANIWFLRTIIQHIDQFFAPEEVDEIWIVHPDPRPRWRDEKRRLTSKRFLSLYHHILKDNWILRLKTDDQDFFDYSLEYVGQAGFTLIDHTYDVDTSPLQDHHHNITTHYGEKFSKEQGRTLKYALWKKQ